MKFRLAEKNDIKNIYQLGRIFNNQRMFGLAKSIEYREAWVMIHNGTVVGFCRIKIHEGKTLDYLKFQEMLINPRTGRTVLDNFMIKIRMLIVGFGYLKSKVTSNKIMNDILERYGWELEGRKFKYSNDSEKSFSNAIYNIKINKFKLKRFGALLV